MKTKKSSRCIGFVCGALAFCTTSGLAAEVPFPTQTGSQPWDILSESAWGGPLPTGRPKFTQTGTYTIGTDGSLAGMYFYNGYTDANRMTFDFTGKKLTLTDSMECPTDWSGLHYVTFKGGMIDFSGNNLPQGDSTHNTKNLDLTVDGCVMTNLSRITIGHDPLGGCALRVTNKSRMYTDGVLAPANWGYDNNTIEISGGSAVTANRFYLSNINPDYPPDCPYKAEGAKVSLTGEGTVLTILGMDGSETYASYLLGYRDAETFYIGGGAVASFGGWSHIGTGKCKNGRVIVTGAGSKLTLGQTRFGAGGGAASTNNMVCAYDGAEVVFWRFWQTGSEHHNGLICSNAVVKFAGTDSNVKDLVFRFQGNNPSILQTTAEMNFIKNGRHFIFDLPQEGYADGCVPYQGTGRNYIYDSNLTLTLNGLREYCEYMKSHDIKRRTQKLIGTGEFANFSGSLAKYFADAVAVWQRELASRTDIPDGVVVKLVYANESVVLDARVKQGLVLTVR